jgi:hypothetical protein
MSNDPTLLAALAKAIEDTAEGCKGIVTAGEHGVNVEFRGRLTTTVKKGKDGESRATVKIPWTKVCALLVQRAGVTREATLKAIRDALTGEGDLDVLPDYDRLTKELADSLPKLKRNGQFKLKDTSLELEIG